MEEKQISDREAVARVLAGERDAYSVLVERYQRPLYRYALSFLRDAHAAQDILQEAFVSAYVKLSTLHDPEKFYPWIKRAVETRCLNRLTRETVLESDDDHPALFAALSDDAPTPDETLLRGERQNKVRQALDRLPFHLGETARLFFLESCPQKEIAQRLSVPLGTVKRRVYDAKIFLQKELMPYMNENELQAARPDDTFAKELREKIATIEHYKTSHGSTKGYGQTVRDTFSLIDGMADETAAREYEARLLHLVYYDESLSYEERCREIDSRDFIARAFKINDCSLLESLLTDRLNGWDISKEGSDAGIAELEAYIRRLRTLPESHIKHAVIGKLMLWGHFCSQLTVYKDFPMARAALRQVIAELSPHALLAEDSVYASDASSHRKPQWFPAVYILSASAEKALNLIERRGDTGDVPYKVRITSQALRKTGDNLRIVCQPGFSYYGLGIGWFSNADEAFSLEPLVAGWFFTDDFFPKNRTVGQRTVRESARGKRVVEEEVVSDSETINTPAGTFENCLHVRRRRQDSKRQFDTWFAEGVGLVRAVETSATGKEKTARVLEEYSLRGGQGFFPLALGNRWRYLSEGASEDFFARIEYETALEIGDTAYLTAVEEILDKNGDPTAYALTDEEGQILR